MSTLKQIALSKESKSLINKRVRFLGSSEYLETNHIYTIQSISAGHENAYIQLKEAKSTFDIPFNIDQFELILDPDKKTKGNLKNPIVITLIVLFIAIALGVIYDIKNPAANDAYQSSTTSQQDSTPGTDTTTSTDTPGTDTTINDTSTPSLTDDGNVWVTLTYQQKLDLVHTAISNIESHGGTSDVSDDWYVKALDSMYGDPSTNPIQIAKAIAMTGAAGNVLHEN